jgi:hypothetical protein
MIELSGNPIKEDRLDRPARKTAGRPQLNKSKRSFTVVNFHLSV